MAMLLMINFAVLGLDEFVGYVTSAEAKGCATRVAEQPSLFAGTQSLVTISQRFQE
jgi:hypothetical protein